MGLRKQSGPLHPLPGPSPTSGEGTQLGSTHYWKARLARKMGRHLPSFVGEGSGRGYRTAGGMPACFTTSSRPR
ncbi:hypothetical protein KL86PLE_90247 [uncultured Pleomorphomonas sp.]|uniref:Uncharacterized protein n=1 Tax=uncultured Pleomorphomonas sp. TaxID=442121 RepID=A0A212LNN8_9HYPH|nr:hypothetical protein KL86PLE_90247 [uncultured Pleomorphomonas sp.]